MTPQEKQEKQEKKAKVDAWRKDVAEKVAKPDPALDAAVAVAETRATIRRRLKKMGFKPAAAGKKEKRACGEAKKPGCLDCAVAILLKTAAKGAGMGCKEMVERMIAKGLWQTHGKTPEATLQSAIIREIGKKGRDSRFTKTGPGQFALAQRKDM